MLSFGLNIVPIYKNNETSLKMTHVSRFIKVRKLSTGYLDDIFLMGRSRIECMNNLFYTEKLLLALGFVINK